MIGCSNCKKRNLCIKWEAFDGYYEDNLYLGSDCDEYEFDEEDEDKEDENGD